MRKNKWRLLFLAVLIACGQDYYPKPRGYPRIGMPARNYVELGPGYPYSFEYPGCSEIRVNSGTQTEPYWIDIYYPAFKGTIHISYKPIDQNLGQYLDDAQLFANKHIPKATAINNKLFVNEQEQVFGMVYEIKGRGAASPYQFYLTDSTRHFLRGALYFNFTPNNDSLAPVIQFIRDDIEHLISTTRWHEK